MFLRVSIVLASLLGAAFSDTIESSETFYPQVKVANRYVVRSDPVDFFQAWQRCRESGLRLATVKSKLDSVKLAEAIETSQSKPKGPWWIAATDLGNSPFKYTWISTNQVLGGYTNFAPKQPDNANGQENCIEVGRFGAVTWNDWHCTGRIPYICERYSGDEC
ncbi:C-type lectin BfL-1-like [Uranotaenia lowii]|uniref:C-type lectin BfL-1-like n=1 Tax=Uranotaenia lowii TaxID=190385 RepID=UPI00247A9D5C|nr:C-type lectin BfL-1-like [Uranotaenia lowii]